MYVYIYTYYIYIYMYNSIYYIYIFIVGYTWYPWQTLLSMEHVILKITHGHVQIIQARSDPVAFQGS